MGYSLHDPCDQELFSEDPQVIAEYLKKHLKSMPLEDYEDFAKQWAGQSWSSTGQVHCNFYHSDILGAIIMGDAAHATSPAIGMGMNTALGDANVLYELLEKFDHDLVKVLPEFSKERVKEGNALTDLSFYLNTLTPSYQMRLELIDLVREKLNKILPRGWVYRAPKAMIGGGMKLSEVYEYASKMGRVERVRDINDSIRRKYFEEKCGLIASTTSGGKTPLISSFLLTSAAIAVSYGAFMMRRTK